MSENFTDKFLNSQIKNLKDLIEGWAKKYDLWYDCGFTTWIEKYDDEPFENPCVLVFSFDSSFYDILNSGPEEFIVEFDALIESNTKFFYEFEDHITMTFWVKENEITLNSAFKEYFEWEWITSLIQEDYGEIYEEIYNRFSRTPSDLQKLSPRQFEKFLDSVFKNNGYRSQLGPGQADGGVDIRLYSEDTVSEILTLVQAKRYKSKNPIKIEAVQAFWTVVEDENANRGLFITTSRYLSGVKKFAERKNKKLILADSVDIQNWSKLASQQIIRNKSKIVSDSYIQQVLNGNSENGLVGKIFSANEGYNMHYSSFAVVLKESKNAVLAMSLPSVIYSDDGYGQIGTHLPEKKLINPTKKYAFFRAKIRKQQNQINLWGQRKLYFLWDGKPTSFSFMD